MINIIVTGVISFLEQELTKHEPELQQAVFEALHQGATLLAAYFNDKISADVEIESLPETKLEE